MCDSSFACRNIRNYTFTGLRTKTSELLEAVGDNEPHSQYNS